VIPDDRTRVSMFSVLGDKLEEQVGKIGKQVEIT
jgi:predicted metalloendopeptidase